MLGNLISIILAVYGFSDGLDWVEVAIIVAWDVAALRAANRLNDCVG
jgi:hypothetical protein